MKTILLIAGREIRQRAKSKAYVLSTAGLAVLLAIAVALPALLGGDDDEPEMRTLAVVGELDGPRADALAAALGPSLEIELVDDIAGIEASLADGEADAGLAGDQVFAPEGSVFSEDAAFAEAIATLLGRADALAAAGLSGGDLVASLAPKPLEVVTAGDGDTADRNARAFVAYIAITVLYGTFIMYGQWMTNGVIEEKSSRVVEVLLAAVKPRQLLAGKLLGLGVLGLVQLLAFLTPAAIVGVALDSRLIPEGVAGLIATAAMWWALGYAFYATVMGSMGATASRPEDAQAVGAPATIVLVVAFFASFAALQDPTGTLAVVLSFVPFTAPMVMVIRVAIGDVALWEIVLAIALLVGSIQLLVVFAGRIYENGLLKTGSRMKIGDAWRAST